MRITHVALGDPEGPAHTGYEADCGPCRVRLLEAFRAPADVPEQGGPAEDPLWNGCPFCYTSANPDLTDHIRNVHPDQFLAWSGHPSAQPGRTVDLYPEPPGDRDDPFTEADENPDIAVHTTEHGIINSDEEPGGLWWVRCSCGWEANGSFAHDDSRPAAARLAQVKAEKHRENPK